MDGLQPGFLSGTGKRFSEIIDETIIKTTTTKYIVDSKYGIAATFKLYVE